LVGQLAEPQAKPRTLIRGQRAVSESRCWSARAWSRRWWRRSPSVRRGRGRSR